MEQPRATAIINMEQVYEWDPEIIFITNFTPTMPDDLFYNRIGGDDWSSVTAVQNRQVYKLPLGAYRTFTPGVDTPLTLRWMAIHMFPELFDDIDIAEEARDYYQRFFDITLTDSDIEAMFNPPREAGYH
jgi:iron complex transport system substrate-binding protein